MRISLIATVRNEADNIAALIDSMLCQTDLPDEIIINDNGSTDGTVQIIEQYIDDGHPIQLVRGNGNIPSGRNHAISQASGSIIACCDAGVTLPPTWLSTLTDPIANNEADVVGGFTEVVANSLWELALGATTYPEVRDIDAANYLPGARSVAFLRAAWERVGGFPEWADTGEDLLFDMQLKARGYRFQFVPAAVVYFRPRPTPRSFFRQYFAYARGDGVGNLWPLRHLIRYSAYSALLVTLLLALIRTPLLALWLIPATIIYTFKPYRRLWPRSAALNRAARVYVLLLVPLIRLIGDSAKMIGYPLGVWHRITNRDVAAARARYTNSTRSDSPLTLHTPYRSVSEIVQ